MAKPRRRGDRWEIRWIDEDGKRRSQSFYLFSDAQKALRKNQIETEEIKAGIRPKAIQPRTFSELADYWLTHRAPFKRSAKDDESIIRTHLLPHFGHLRIDSIDSKAIKEFEQTHWRRVSDKTLHNYLTLLGSMLNQALDLKWITEKPKIVRPKLIQKPFNYLETSDEVQALLRSASFEREGVLELYATAVMTGMRAGELAGLMWTDVDLIGRRIHVRRSFTGPTKSGRIRIVPILNSLLPILSDWKHRSESSTVFTNLRQKMLAPSDRIFQETLHRTLKRAQVKRIRFHDLRHTFASHWMMHGGSLYALRDILGHSTIKMTEQYAHLAPEVFKQDLARFDFLLRPSETTGPCVPRTSLQIPQRVLGLASEHRFDPIPWVV